MIRIFIGFDHRQPVSYQVLHHSILRRASVPVSITPLHLPQLPITRQGLTPFTFSRYLVPWLCDYEGHAIFMDSDMLCLCDVAELWRMCELHGGMAVRVRAGLPVERQFERPSLMLFNNEKCRALTPEYVEDPANHPQSFQWTYGCHDDGRTALGHFPPEYNRLVGYENCDDAKILHYTAGVPAWPETRKLGYADLWLDELHASTGIAPWEALMGNSVHMQNLGMTHDSRDATA